MKRQLIALALSLSLLSPAARAADLPNLSVNGTPVSLTGWVDRGTTYVPLRQFSTLLCPEADVRWETDRAVVTHGDNVLTAVPGQRWITVNGHALYLPDGVAAREGSLYLPIRVLARACGASVTWEADTGMVSVTSGTGFSEPDYDPDALYWLSRIISAESRGESLEGQIAVGNVVLNRVASPDFPNTIYGVIFDSRWGGQFEPVENGTVYADPAESSILAAKLCLSGANTVGDSLYFLDPKKAENLWTMENRNYVTTIGVHWFYA